MMANTLQGAKFYISVDTLTPVAPAVSVPVAAPADLAQADYEALTWLEVKNVGKIGEMGTSTNIVKYDEIATTVSQKQKGIKDAGSPDIECARNATDGGQIAMRAAAKTNYNYAFKVEYADAPDASTSNTMVYNRGVVTGPKRNNGGNEDFILETFSLGFVQEEIIVDPAAL